MYNYSRVRWKSHGRGIGQKKATSKMATPNRKYNKCPFKDPFDKDLDPLIHKLQGTWFDSSSCRVGGTAKMRVIGTRVYSFFSFGTRTGSTLHVNPSTQNVEFVTNSYQKGIVINKETPSVTNILKFVKKNQIQVESYQNNKARTKQFTGTFFREQIDPRKAECDLVLSSLTHIYNATKSRQNDIKFCMELPAGEYYVCSATGDPMHPSEHDLYVDDKLLIPSIENAQKIEKEKNETKKAEPKILSVDLRINAKIRNQFLNKARVVSSKDPVLATMPGYYSERNKQKSLRAVMCSNSHKMIVGVGTYQAYICDTCRMSLNGVRWHCSLCREDFCFSCNSQFDDSPKETEEKEEEKKDNFIFRARYVKTDDIPDSAKHPDEKIVLTGGVFEFLGKRGDPKNTFQNPTFDGNIQVSHSKTYSSSYPAHSVVDPNSTKTFMDGIYNGTSYFDVDLGEGRSLVLDTFAMSMKSRYQYPCCNFKIQASNDRKDPDSWETLSIHIFDNSMKNINLKARSAWNVGTAQSPIVYEGPPIVNPWNSRAPRWTKCVSEIREIFPDISRRMAERIMNNSYVNANYFAQYDEKSVNKGEIILSFKRQSPAGQSYALYTTMKGAWGVYIYSASTYALQKGVKIGMHITHAFDGNPKIDLNSKVIVRGKQKAVVKKLIYPEKKKDKAKKISYKWQWEDGTLGSGQWKDYIPKDDTAIETLFQKKGKQCTLVNSWGTYIINFTGAYTSSMQGTQKKQASGYVRPIRRVPKTGKIPPPVKPIKAVVQYENGKTEETDMNHLKAMTKRIPIKTKADWDKIEKKKPSIVSFVAQDPYASLLKRCVFHRDEMKKFSKTSAFTNPPNGANPIWPNDLKVESYNLFGAYPNKSFGSVVKGHYGYGYNHINEKKRSSEEDAELKKIQTFKENASKIDPSALSAKSAAGLIMSRMFRSDMNKRKAYRFFRIQQTGRNGYNSSISNYMYLGYWELYGTLTGKSWGRVRNDTVKQLKAGETKFSGDFFQVKRTVPDRFSLQLPLHRSVTVTRNSKDDSWGFVLDSYGRVQNVTDLSLEAKGIISLQSASYAYNQITAVNGVNIRNMDGFTGQSSMKKCIDDVMKDKTTCTLTFGRWDYFIPAKCNWSASKMPLGFRIDPKTFRIVEVNPFGEFDGFKIGMRVTGLHFYYYKASGTYKQMNEKRFQDINTRLNQLKASNCRFVAVAVEASKDECMFVHSSSDKFFSTIQRGGKSGTRMTVNHAKRDATRLNALWVLDKALLNHADLSSFSKISCVTDVFTGLAMKRDMHATRMKRSLNKVKYYQARKYALDEELSKINTELEDWISTRRMKRDEMEYRMHKDLEILHGAPLETARLSYADADILVKQLSSQLKNMSISKEDKIIAKVDLKYAEENLVRAEEDVSKRVARQKEFQMKCDESLASFDRASEIDKLKLEKRRHEVLDLITNVEKKRHMNETKIARDQKQFEHIAYLIAHANGHDTHHFVNASTGLRRYVLDQIVVPKLASVYETSMPKAWGIALKSEKNFTIRGLLSVVKSGEKDSHALMRRFPRV